jgi:hypothetical protein
MEGGAKRPTVVKCEKHGLHYDSATQTGCVICRREAGQPARGAAAAAPGGAATAAPGGSLGMALAMTALLLAGTAFGLLAAHEAVSRSLQRFMSPGEAFSGGGNAFEKSLDRDLQALGGAESAAAESLPVPAGEGDGE